MGRVRDTVFRMLPHATRPGLRAIGAPGPDAPVLVTGNYALTVHRLERVLRGQNVWLLVANSRGINVWCAATGGHFTDHDVIAAIRTSRLAERVEHRRLLLPQLAATGIEPRHIHSSTGFDSAWGPARLEDLPVFLDRGRGVTRAQRKMRFPLWERLEMAVIWALPIAVITSAVSWLVAGWRVAAITGVVVTAAVFGLFSLLPWLTVVGSRKWLTYGAVAAAVTAVGTLVLWLTGGAETRELAALGVGGVGAMAILSIDLAGTTPWYPGTINSVGNRFHLELVEERCTGAAACVQVCPRDVLAMDGKARKVRIVRAEQCVLCAACVVQCPDDALQFRFEDGRVVAPDAIRATRVNMLGRRVAPGARDERVV